jgi:hypothetical protein
VELQENFPGERVYPGYGLDAANVGKLAHLTPCSRFPILTLTLREAS